MWTATPPFHVQAAVSTWQAAAGPHRLTFLRLKERKFCGVLLLNFKHHPPNDLGALKKRLLSHLNLDATLPVRTVARRAGQAR